MYIRILYVVFVVRLSFFVEPGITLKASQLHGSPKTIIMRVWLITAGTAALESPSDRRSVFG